MGEDSDKVPGLDGGESKIFSPSKRPGYQPLSRSSTWTGFQRSPSSEPLMRRKTSRQFSRTSVDADSILLDRPATSRQNTTDDEPEDTKEQCHSISLIFVALPAFAGLFFENGSAVMTDVLMLGLGCLFLYWSVKWPWQWYYSTQELKLADNVDSSAEFAIVEDSDDEHEQKSGEPRDRAEEAEGESKGASGGAKASGQYPSRSEVQRREAVKALQTLEVMALTSCFLSPAAVAYMLHSIRPYLSRPSGGVVSNSNLTLFVLAAELRPILHFFRLVDERTLHLQRVVTSLPVSEERQLEERVEALTKRIEEFESRAPATAQSPLAGGGTAEIQEPPTAATAAGGSTDLERSIRQSIQPQLDALNRAVRRYEKRATTQAIVTEARLQDLDARVKDALSLAAAASRNSQKAGLLNQFIDLVKWMLTRPLEALSQILLLPFQLAGEAWRFLFGPRRKRKKGTGGGQAKYASEFKGKQRLEAK